MLVQQAKSGDLHVSQHATWRMSAQVVRRIADELDRGEINW
jgi:hypothetical protein